MRSKASMGSARLTRPTVTMMSATNAGRSVSSMDKSELEALLARIDVWLLIFGVIVVIGVAGESFFGIRHWWNSRKLQRIQNAESAAQREEIARLNREAGEARNSAAKAEAQATQAGEGTAKALANAAAANERSAKLEVEAAKQRERAAKAERDLLELKQRMAPRHISAAQEGKLSNDLKPLVGKSVGIFIITGQPENEAFGNELASILKKVGLNVGISSGMLFGGSTDPGISLMIGKNRLVDANILAAAVSDAGLSRQPVPAQHLGGDDTLQIVVAPR